MKIVWQSRSHFQVFLESCVTGREKCAVINNALNSKFLCRVGGNNDCGHLWKIRKREYSSHTQPRKMAVTGNTNAAWSRSRVWRQQHCIQRLFRGFYSRGRNEKHVIQPSTLPRNIFVVRENERVFQTEGLRSSDTTSSFFYQKNCLPTMSETVPLY